MRQLKVRKAISYFIAVFVLGAIVLSGLYFTEITYGIPVEPPISECLKNPLESVSFSDLDINAPYATYKIPECFTARRYKIDRVEQSEQHIKVYYKR